MSAKLRVWISIRVWRRRALNVVEEVRQGVINVK